MPPAKPAKPAKPRPVGRVEQVGIPAAESPAPAAAAAAPAGTLRRVLLRIWQSPSVANATELAELRKALLNLQRSGEMLDGALLGMAAAQCARLGDGQALTLICGFAASRLELCGSRAVVEMAQAALHLDCAEPGFLRALMAFLSGCSLTNSRDLAAASKVLLHSLRERNLCLDHEGALRGLAEVAVPFFAVDLAVNVATSGLLRDAVEFIHAAVHVAGSPDVSLNGPEIQTVEEAFSSVLRFIRRHLHLASARDSAMVAGSVAQLWQVMPQLREDVLWPCLEDVAQGARFKSEDFNCQDMAVVAQAFAKLERPNEVYATVLDRCFCMPQASDRDLCYLLWAAATVPRWADSPFVGRAVLELSQRDAAKLASKDLMVLLQSLGKLLRLPGPAQAAHAARVAALRWQLQVLFLEGVRRAQSFGTKDLACLERAREALEQDEAPVAGYGGSPCLGPPPGIPGIDGREDASCHSSPGSHSHSDGHSHGHSHDHDGHGHSHEHSGHSHSTCTAVISHGDAHGHQTECEGEGTFESSTSPKEAPSCENETCCPYIRAGPEMRLNAHCSFTGHCVRMKNTFIHIPCSSFSDSESDGECAVCSFKRSRSCDDLIL